MNKLSKRDLIQTLIFMVVMVILFVILRINVFSPVLVTGNSMEPILSNKERLIILKHQKISRFDLVTFKSPVKNEDKNYIKRIIGLPGDEIVYMDDVLYINGQVFQEPYLDEKKLAHQATQPDVAFTADFSLTSLAGKPADQKVVVPDNSYFVLGDNRPNSNDSRNFGFIKKSDIIGEVKFAYWPLSKFGPVSTIQEKEENGITDN